ncbi:MAG: tyrosine-type recombinase/integrase [Pseudomonadota bacterium]|uniref:tyrosine-type recombinase/integrase n=1 Tax=Gallaecimonas pentaromativorans TaxID=584787 RepID=UPI000A8C27E8|nr:tyrosine-type recombinase/integrase [Gallaecimonas pentaromativorans]MED5525427.1 tyrosine-type recombinase/integrase [Pseudomonadota bacterium]
MDLIDLKLISHTSDSDVYLKNIESAVSDFSPMLLDSDQWNQSFITSLECFKVKTVGQRAMLDFSSLPRVVKNELKLYWAKVLSDVRNDSRSIIERRIYPHKWINDNWPMIASYFKVTCIAEIPSPMFPEDGSVGNTPGKVSHNKELIALFSSSENNKRRKEFELETIKNNSIEIRSYVSSRISTIGDFHKGIIINREQFKPLASRLVIYYNDLYSEDDVRFKDAQRSSDSYLNFYIYPPWMRKAIYSHVVGKIENNELGPKTLVSYFRRFSYFRDFMHEKFDDPKPSLISNQLVEDEFLSWGNDKGLAGKNWFTDTIAMLHTAAITFPHLWPSISVSSRVTRKVKNSHYKRGLGRIGHNQESAGRSYSQRIIDEINVALVSTPYPVSTVFSLITSVGMRAEDGHAVLYDCLQDDPHDDNFMLLHYWQNKVKKWNIKPLLKKDKAHSHLINLIEEQRQLLNSKYKRKTKYLFPSFTGKHESFYSPSWTLSEIKKSIIKAGIKDDEGSPLKFHWHALRHTKGTSLAESGHDILTIMMELGHTSPDMATVYVNNRLKLKKMALLEKGGGRYITIKGEVDDKIGELLVRKEGLAATRVCGGACTLPAQIGDWCEHANACYTCNYYRADSKDVDFFKNERSAIEYTIDEQQSELEEIGNSGRQRQFDITKKRLDKNKDVFTSLTNIIEAIEVSGTYKGQVRQAKTVSLEKKDD